MTEQEAIRELKVKYLGDSDAIVEAKELAINALEKQIAKKPVGLRKNVCPNCSWIVTYECDSYCPRCGQRILWEDSEV